MCKSSADQRAIQKEPAEGPLAQDSATPTTTPAPHSFAFHHHNTLFITLHKYPQPNLRTLDVNYKLPL